MRTSACSLDPRRPRPGRVSVLLSLLLLAGLVGAAPSRAETVNPQKRPATARLLRKIEKTKKNGGQPGKAFDKPAEAQEFFLRKRSPDGVSPISAQKYLEAQAAIKGMPVYSTSTRSYRTRPGAPDQAPNAGTLGAWQSLGPGNIGGRTRALVIDPTTPSTLYAGGVAGGVWKSTDSGASWQPLSDLMANIAVASLAITPGQPLTIYAGTGEGFFNADAVRGAGIFKTTDGGTTWARLAATATSSFHYVSKIVVSPSNPLRLYAATSTGVQRSLDGGATWTAVQAATTARGFTDMVIRTDSPTDVVFASEGNYNEQAKVYRNTDAGGAGTWGVVLSDGTSMGRTSLALAPSNQEILYALSANNAAGNFQDGLYKVFRSTAGGASGTWSARWTQDNDPAKLGNLLLTNPVYANLAVCGFGAAPGFYNQGWYDNVIAVDPVDPNVVWTGGIDLFRSVDGGQSWGLASYWWFDASSGPSYNHADHHAIVFDPAYDGMANQVMYVGNDGGIYRTENARSGSVSTDVCGGAPGTLAWKGLNSDYGVTQFYDGAVYPDGLTFFGGTQDNGTVRGTTADGTNAWSTISGGDGGYVAVDPTNTQILFSEYTGLSIQKSTDGGTTWGSATSGISDTGFLFIAPFEMDPSASLRLWAGGTYPWRTTNGATSWTRAGTALSGSASAIAVAPTDANYVLFGTSSGSIARSSSALTSTSTTVWASVQPRSGYCSSVTFDPTNKNVAYATYSTFGGTHVWKSTDAGATWGSLDGAGATGIPGIPAHAVAVDPANSLRLYVGTDLGVFVSNDGGANWAVENSGFANVVTETLVTRGSYLYAFTHGRGAYRVPLADPSCAQAPTATVSGSTTTCQGSSAVLSVALTGAGPWDLTWSDGATQLGIAASPALRTVSPGSTTTYSVSQVISGSGGCVAAGTGSATVTIDPAPAAPAAGNGGPVCVGGTISLTASTVAGATYAWNGPNGFSSDQQNPTIPAATAAAAGTYSVTVTGAGGGCRSVPGTTNVVVKATPEAPSITAPAWVGPGESFTASVPEVVGVSYAWTVTNGTVTAGNGTRQVTVTAGATGPVTVAVTAANTASTCTSSQASTPVPLGLPTTRFHTVSPCRLFDTRASTGEQAAAPILAAGETRTFEIGTRCGLSPATIRALSVNQTVTASVSTGELVLFRGDVETAPVTSSLSYAAGKTRANNSILELSRTGDGTFKVFNRSAGAVHFILDVNGTFQ